jgi:hypothetical protein
MRPTIAIATLAAAAVLSGCGAAGAAADSSQVSQYVASGTASSAPAPSGGGGTAPTCFTAADVKSAMGIDVVDLTGGMRQYGTFWNCGYVPTATTLPGVSVQLTVASAAEADATFERLTGAMRIARGPSAQPDALQLGDRAMAYGTPSGAVAAAVAGDRLYTVETMYGTAGDAFRDKKDATIELLRKTIGD